MQKISPCLWYDHEAEEAVNFYVSIFKNSRITRISHYGEAGPGKPGSVLTVGFEIEGQSFTALNGGPIFKFNEAISLMVDCTTQEEIDYYWDRLSEGGKIEHCGWLRDRYGLCWQIVPRMLVDLISGPDAARANRVMTAMLKMVKFDIAELQRAAAE